MTSTDKSAAVASIRQLVADDSHACTFQSFGQYRTALLKAIDALEVLNRRPRPMCRDCADENGTCPGSGLPCDMSAVIRNARASLTTPSKEPAGAVATIWYRGGEVEDLEADPTAAPLPDGEYRLYAAPGAAIDAGEQEYPQLPEGWTTTMTPDPEGTPYTWFDETQMRAYVDADRKARQLSACNFCLAQAAEARTALTSRPEAPAASAPAAEVAQPPADERAAFEVWARSQGYQHDELARSKIGIVSPEYFNPNTESAYKAYQAGRNALASSPSSAPAESGWQPIETAPKDGTQIVLLWDGKVVVGHWFRGESVWSGPAQNWIKDQWGLNSVAYRSAPTLWQPLPAAPQAVQAGGEGGK